MKKNIEDIVKDRILILDGAMGTMIQQYSLTEEDFRKGWFEEHNQPLKGNNDLLSLTRPDIIKAIHRAYFEAGADIVETNTFGASSIVLEEYQIAQKAYEINKKAAMLAKECANNYSSKE